MEAALVMVAIAASIWGLVYAWRGSLLAGCVITLLFGYVLTYNFWRLPVGPVSLNAGRVLVGGLLLVLAWRWRQGLVRFQPIAGADWFAGLFVAYITFRFLQTDYPAGIEPSVSPFWRLIECFWVPLALYLVGRTVEFGERGWKLMLLALSGFGLYLSATALAEVHGQWWAVFPKFIADPELGTHFGRARGPALNSVSLGVYLSLCFWAAWFLWSRVPRLGRLVLVAAMGVMCLALYYTYTRSAWLALAFTLAVIPAFHLPRSWKPVWAGAIVLGGVLGLAIVGDKLIDLNRTDTDSSASHSVSQRKTFLIVSMRMFADQPLLGCGFGRFYDQKLPYLADRNQQIELESIRELDHHNTFLSILTETGLVGISLFLAMLVAWGRKAWQICRDQNSPVWLQTQGLFALAAIAIYAINGLFHDLSLLPSEQWLLFFLAGASVGWSGQARAAALSPNSQHDSLAPVGPMPTGLAGA